MQFLLSSVIRQLSTPPQSAGLEGVNELKVK
jgi:hypothetical protein